MKHSPGKPVLCLAASGGGHLRQIIDLEPLWRDFPHFVVTEDTALGRSLAERVETHFVPHFALGQARLGKGLLMLARAWQSCWRGLAIVYRRRPDVVITTGAGSQLFVLLWARILGAKIIMIDSFARFEGPSAFARLAGPLAHHRFAQSEQSARAWPGAQAFDPLKQIATSPPQKRKLLLATVGATLPFDRLIAYVTEARKKGLIDEEIVLQTGADARSVEALDGVTSAAEFDYATIRRILDEASLVVCHAGTGSIITALQAHCRVIVIPRAHVRGEHYDDHQAEIADSFAARGLVQLARDEASFAAALIAARAMQPRPVTTDYAALIAALRPLLEARSNSSEKRNCP